jgi:hypothetical protein
MKGFPASAALTALLGVSGPWAAQAFAQKGLRCEENLSVGAVLDSARLGARDMPSPAATVIKAGPPASREDTAAPPGLPVLGKWMIDKNGAVAHWLGVPDPHNGLEMDEPINVVLRVDARSPQEAKQKVLDAAAAAGFTLRNHHSSGYSASIARQSAPQFPDMDGCAFSDGTYLLPNNHGRVFGPVLWEGRYYFTAALSRETINPKRIMDHSAVYHLYSSFRRARDRFAARLVDAERARISGYADLANTMSSGPQSTGDHDGKAVVLEIF